MLVTRNKTKKKNSNIQIFNNVIKNFMMPKGFVCVSNVQSQGIDLEQSTEYKIPIVLACVTEQTQVADSFH